MSPPQRSSITEPPFFDGTNYPEWKVKMEHYIKAIIGVEAWLSIRTGWSPPAVKDSKGKRLIKPETNYSESESEASGNNSKGLNAIFYSVGPQQFKRIATCSSAKEAWDTLQAAYEKSGMCREEERLILDVRFSKMVMEEEESISAYYEKVLDIAYEAGTVGRVYSERKLVEKILWSLPRRFEARVSAIRECKDVKLGELIGLLQSYEKALERRTSSCQGIVTQF